METGFAFPEQIEAAYANCPALAEFLSCLRGDVLSELKDDINSERQYGEEGFARKFAFRFCGWTSNPNPSKFQSARASGSSPTPSATRTSPPRRAPDCWWPPTPGRSGPSSSAPHPAKSRLVSLTAARDASGIARTGSPAGRTSSARTAPFSCARDHRDVTGVNEGVGFRLELNRTKKYSESFGRAYAVFRKDPDGLYRFTGMQEE